MEEFPPSYQSAQEALTEYWSLVSNYIPSSDLCSASQVSRRWHAIFAPILWGNPAGHWGIENDQVYGWYARKGYPIQRLTFLSGSDQIQENTEMGSVVG